MDRKKRLLNPFFVLGVACFACSLVNLAAGDSEFALTWCALGTANVAHARVEAVEGGY